MEHKDIDRLFQEKLKDMEVTPHPKVWNAIEQKLQKKKRRVLPIWWFTGGVAALLVVGLFLFSDFTEEEQQQNQFPIITEESVEESKKEKGFEIEKEFNNQEEMATPVIAKEDFEEKKAIKSNEIIKITTNKSKEENSVVEITNKNNSEEGIVKGVPDSEKIALKKNFDIKKETKNLILVDKKPAKKEKGNNSGEGILKGISSSEEIAMQQDSTSKKGVPKKDFIAEITKEKKAEKNKNKEENKWAVSPIVGVLKSNSFSQASALDADFNTNNFSGENTISYGINVSYQLNDKWTLKSGIQLQNTTFTTEDVTLIPASAILIANSIDNVSPNFNNGSLSDQDIIINDALSGGNSEQFETEQGSVQQSYGYIEIPLEVKYTFFNSRKIKTSIISGFSSLILNDNTIVGESVNFNREIGGATNLNTINFSGNLGFDFDVKLSEKLNLNINPMFKTQLNTFSNNSNGFKPYNIGVYTGIRYHF